MPLLALATDQFDMSASAKIRDQIDALDTKAGIDVTRDLDRVVPKMLDRGIHELFAGDAEAAMKTYDELVALAQRELGESPRVAEWNQEAGLIAQAAKHPDRAFDHFVHALAMWEHFGVKTPLVVKTFGSATRALFDLDRYRDAVTYATNGLELGVAIHDDEGVADRRIDLGEALLGAGDAVAARASLEQAVVWRQDHGAASTRGRAKVMLARALWSGSAADRKRALDLARSGRSDIAAAIALLDPKAPLTRYQKPGHDKLLADTDAWLRTHH
jgi:tetratricopeptide (TPR) repeat protein